MDLRDRKRIKNGALPHFYSGDDFAADNTGNIKPATKKGAGFNMDNLGNGLIGAINMYGMLTSGGDYNKSADQLIAEGKKNTTNVGGYSVTNYQVDRDAEMEEVNAKNNQEMLNDVTTGAASGAAIGSVIPGLGTAAGTIIGGTVGAVKGWFNSRSRAEEARKALKRAEVLADKKSDYSSMMAQTNISKDVYNKNHFQQDVTGFFNGKDVYTATGRGKGKQNAWLSKGEYIWDGEHVPSEVTTGPNDTAPGYVRGKDMVFTNNPNIPAPAGFKTIAQAVPYAAATGHLWDLANFQKNMHMRGYRNGKDCMPGYFNGKVLQNLFESLPQEVRNYRLPGSTTTMANQNVADTPSTGFQNPSQNIFAERMSPVQPSWWNKTWGNIKNGLTKFGQWNGLPNAITSGLGALTGWQQYKDAQNQAIRTPDIYENNFYEGAALDKLRNLRIDGRPMIQNIHDNYRNMAYDIKRGGGTTGSERMKGLMQAALGTQRNLAQMMQQIQQQNNQYTTNWANAALQSGAQTAQRRQAANEYRENYMANANASRLQGMQMGQYNILNNLNKFYENEFKRKQFNKMYNLYAQDVSNNRPN